MDTPERTSPSSSGECRVELVGGYSCSMGRPSTPNLEEPSPSDRRICAKKLGATRLRRPRHTRTMAPGTQEVLLRYEAARGRVVIAMERAEWAIEDAKRFLARMSAHAQKRRPRRDGSGRVVT